MVKHNFTAITELPEELYCDNWIARKGLHYLNNFSKDKPWHLVLNFTGPHDPYDVTPTMAESWAEVDFPATQY